MSKLKHSRKIMCDCFHESFHKEGISPLPNNQGVLVLYVRCLTSISTMGAWAWTVLKITYS